IVEVVLVEMDRGVMPWPMPPGCLFAGPARAAYRPRRQVAEAAVQRVRPAVEDAVACYFLAEIPIGGTGGRVGLQRCAWVMYARHDGRIFDPTVQKRRVRIFVQAQGRSGCGAEDDADERSERAGGFRLAAVGHAPAALQGSLPETDPPRLGDDPQFVPAPLQHRRRDAQLT